MCPDWTRTSKQMKYLLIFLVCFGCSVGFSFQACLLHLEFVDVAGKPRRGINIDIKLVDVQHGKSIEFTSGGPTASICDYDFGIHTLKISYPNCFEFVVYDIGKNYPKEETHKFIVPSCRGGTVGAGGNACLLHLRVSGNAWSDEISGARVLSDGLEKGKTDEYGRFTTFVKLGEEATFIVESNDFSAKAFKVKCDPGLYRFRQIQQSISLDRKVPGKK
jgi:hypothetical protein